jgi:hypothetical protein
VVTIYKYDSCLLDTNLPFGKHVIKYTKVTL